jgi:hypothetical protein
MKPSLRVLNKMIKSMNDLLEDYENLPDHIKAILDSFDEDGDSFKECERVEKELEVYGYSVDYDLSGELFDLENHKFIRALGEIVTKFYPSDRLQKAIGEELVYRKDGEWFYNLDNLKKMKVAELQELVKKIDSIWESELALTCAVAGRAMAQYDTNQMGGLMTSYDLTVEVAKQFLIEFPINFNWEEHRINDGEDWDMEILAFVEKKMREKGFLHFLLG